MKSSRRFELTEDQRKVALLSFAAILEMFEDEDYDDLKVLESAERCRKVLRELIKLFGSTS